jgi:cobalt-zinc-cadmium efflux system protein
LICSFMAFELAVAVVADSLAVLADAAHMLGDAGALALALFAAWIAARPASPERTFGYMRAEILAALANGVALIALAIWIFLSAIARLRDPAEPLGGWILVAGLVGVAVNVAAAAALRGGSSLNLRAAVRHVLADLLGSVGVIAAGAIVLLTGWAYADPLVSLAIALLVVTSSWTILRDSVAILLEGVPAGMDSGEIGRAMVAVPGVQEVHDLHVWTITSGFASLSAHVLVPDGDDCHAVRRSLERMLAERFGLTHTTLQVEHAAPDRSSVAIGSALRRETPLR